MRLIKRKLKQVDPRDYIKRSAKVDDCAQFIGDDVIVKDPDGRTLLIYQSGISSALFDRVRSGLLSMRFGIADRSSGMVSHSEIFGYAPRNIIRNLPCRAACPNLDFPAVAAAIDDLAKFANEWYAKLLPEEHQSHFDEIRGKVDPDWIIQDTVYTSSIANKNNVLRYHYDTGNFKSCNQVMLGLRSQCEGGWLAIPELDMTFEIGDSSLIVFDGQSIIHGVTPIKLEPRGYRFTIVYYSLRQMWTCLPIDEEIADYRRRRTEVELKAAMNAN